MTDYPIQLPDYALARWRHVQAHGGELLVLVPVEKQPPEGVGQIFGPEEYWPILTAKGGQQYAGQAVYGAYDEDGEWGTECPYRPGDVLVWTATECECQRCRDQAAEHRLPIARVGCGMVKDVTGREWLAAGVDNGKSNPAMGKRWENMQRIAAQDTWTATYASRPELAWERAFVWKLWIRGE